VTAFSPSAQRTRSRSKPVRAADQTGTRSAPDPSAQRTRPVRAADTNPHESTGTHLSNPPTRVRDTKTASTDRFHEFWDAYPRKIGDKQGALKTWSKNRLDEKANQIIQTVKARVAGDHKWSDLQFVPYPATYLKQERWNDEWQTNAKRPSVRDSFANEIYTGTPENEFGF
jgi:hypothetical protein